MEQEPTNQPEQPVVKNSFKAKLLGWLRIHLMYFLQLLVKHLTKQNEQDKKEDESSK